MTSMFVPEPVISLSIRPDGNETPNFSRALNRFKKEDPTFRVHVDSESQETIISGMGELHLDIYVERMKREYNVACVTGKPRVAFRETITARAPYEYTHKKQSGGAGQFARVKGYIEPMEFDPDTGKDTEFVNSVVGTNIPTGYIPAVDKGFQRLSTVVFSRLQRSGRASFSRTVLPTRRLFGTGFPSRCHGRLQGGVQQGAARHPRAHHDGRGRRPSSSRAASLAP
jgi:hypothetical protein